MRKNFNKIKSVCFISVICVLLIQPQSLSGQPAEPILILNSSFHTSAIRDISTDAQGQKLMTVSEDKTARLWDARTGNALRTLRPPIGYGDEGNLYAGALSPCGNFAAFGGNTGGSWNNADSSLVTIGNWTSYARQLTYSVYLFSTQTGELLLNIDHFESEIQTLLFSPDGAFLLVGLADNSGVRIVKVSDGTEARQLIGYGGSVRDMAFSASGQLAVIADDRYLRLYSRSFQMINTLEVDGTPTSVVFSTDGSTIAVGGSVINIFSGNNFRKTTLPASSKSITDALAFAGDGVLYSGEYGQDGKSRIVVRKDGKRTEISAGTGRVTGITALPDGSIVYATEYPEMGRILPDNKPPVDWEGNVEGNFRRTADMVALSQRQQEVFQINHDATKAGLVAVDKDVLFFSLTDRSLKIEPSNLPKAVDRIFNPALRIEKWKDSSELTLNGRALNVLGEGEINRCVDISADGKIILLGTNHNLICLDGRGKVIWKRNLTEECISVKISGDGQIAVIALNNGTYAWYNTNNGMRTITLFVHPDHRRWILWTPDGFYDCSAGAEELIGWNLNQGKYKASAFFPVAQFRNDFYRPAIIDQIAGIASSDDVRAVEQVVTLNLPPEINILNPQPESSSSYREVRLQYSVNTNSAYPLRSLRVLVNGRPVQLLTSISQGLNEVVVNIPEADSEISLIARNEHSASVPASVRIKWTGVSESDIFKPKLYILAVGISDYMNENLSLQFAAKDANDFANIMSKQKGLLYSDVFIKLLTNEKGNKYNILDGLDWIQTETTNRDVAMLFFAGHGMNDNTDNFFYMPVEADPNRLRATCINYVEIKQSVAAIAGKVVLFMDACHSGGVMGTSSRRVAAADIIGFVNELASAENGAIVFTSSTGRQFSLEDPAWNNGAFTKALVEGLGGEADLFKRSSISIKTLDVYVSQRVKDLTKGQQAPTTIIPASISDFPIAVSLK